MSELLFLSVPPQHKLEAALLALGQFQHALSELQAWLNHTHTTLDTQRPVSSDPKAIEIELAKHHVRLPAPTSSSRQTLISKLTVIID